MATLSSDAGGQLALDANALASLRAQAKTSPNAAVGKAAGQFEALFVQMLLKQMRETLPQDGPLSSDTMKSYTSMFDQQVAQQLGARGIGLRKVIEQQLGRQLGTGVTNGPNGASAPNGANGGDPNPADKVDGTRKLDSSLRSTIPDALRARLLTHTSRTASVASKDAAPAPASGGIVPASVQAFVDALRPQAEAVAKSMGIPVQNLIAQAGLETGWGRSLPRTASGDTSHNLFGIKASGQWKGHVADARTTEIVDGQAIRTTERFRAYDSVKDAFSDVARLLKGSARYAAALAHADNPRAYAEGLQRAGYATDPHYGAKLARSIDLVSRTLAASSPPAQVSAGTADKSKTVS